VLCTLLPGAWPASRILADAEHCSTGLGPNGKLAAHSWQRLTSDNAGRFLLMPAKLAVYPDADYAGTDLRRVFKTGTIDNCIRVEQHEIGKASDGDISALLEAKAACSQASHFMYRGFQFE